MRRWVYRALGAGLIIGLGILTAAALTSHSLASATLKIRGTQIRFTITQRDDLLYASASELRSWSNGFRTEMLIGKIADLDQSKAAIVMVDEDQVRLVVDDVVVSFDPVEKRFVLLDPAAP